jgi:hypothetical protein
MGSIVHLQRYENQFKSKHNKEQLEHKKVVFDWFQAETS